MIGARLFELGLHSWGGKSVTVDDSMQVARSRAYGGPVYTTVCSNGLLRLTGQKKSAKGAEVEGK